MRNSKGFTLVEMAIVLVIIGIILAAVLKGGDLIDNAKEKQFKTEISTLITSYYNYYDKYGRIPGDDNTATTRWAAAANGNNNGLISTAAELSPQTGTLDHLRRAGFINDQPVNTNTAFTSLVYNGATINFDSALSVVQFTKGSNYLTIAGMSAADMAVYDTKYDDGVFNTGDVQSAGAAAYATGTNMIIRVR